VAAVTATTLLLPLLLLLLLLPKPFAGSHGVLTHSCNCPGLFPVLMLRLVADVTAGSSPWCDEPLVQLPWRAACAAAAAAAAAAAGDQVN
jgi:hypothetical protein